MKPVISSAFAVLTLLSAFTPLQITLAQGVSDSSSVQSCTASSAGNPCYGTGNNVGQDKSGANPVNLTNGNKFQEEMDFIGAPEYSGLEFYRYYNSTQLTPSFIGQGWRHSYSRKLYWQGERPQIILDDSTRILFESLQDDMAKSLYNEHGSLSRITLPSVMERLNEAAGLRAQDKKSLSEYFSNNYIAALRGDLWLWKYPSGAIDIFNSKGNLIVSQMPASEAVFIERDLKPGPTHEAILTVQNRKQKRLDFHYDILGESARLSHINTPNGRLEFQHDLPSDEKNPRLLAVNLIDGAKITYEHKAVAQGFDEQLSPYLIVRAKHFNSESLEPYRDISWRYNSQNRAIKVIFHRHEELNRPLSMVLNYVKIPQHNGDTGLTEVTQFITEHEKTDGYDTRQKTLSRFHTTMLGSQYLLTKAEGAPCFKCPAPGTEVEYNEAGYITAFNTLDIKRNIQDNRINSIGVAHRGWPGLRIFYDKDGKPYAWSSLHTGKTFFELDPDTLYPRYKNYANGTRMLAQKLGDKNRESHFISYGHLLGGRELDTQKNFLKKFLPTQFILSSEDDKKMLSIKKLSQTLEHSTMRRWSNRVQSNTQDFFNTYQQDKTVEHILPEKGTLYYHYNLDHTLNGIYWKANNTGFNEEPKLLYQRVNAYERKYGNQLRTQARKNPTVLKNSVKLELLKEEEQTPYWQEIRYYHDDGLLAAEHHLSPSLKMNQFRQYEFNSFGQLIRTDTQQENNQSQDNKTDLYAWQLGGASFSRQQIRTTIRGEKKEKQVDLIIKNIKRDNSGFIQQMDDLELIYDERNLLTEIRKNAQTLATYTYDGLSQRIRKTTPEGETQYYYLNQQLVAEAFVPSSRTDKDYQSTWNEKAYVTRRYIYDELLPVALIDYTENNDGQIYYIHTDGSGQPFLVTDENQKTVWLANNEPFGKSRPIIEEIEFNLRLPGQYYDAESGLHQNIYRNYDPEVGHYLEPDPLGPVSNNDVFGYANQNPRQFIDPLGLLMFVFDGTTNTPSSQTNAYKLGLLYDEGPVHYIEGLGTQEANNKVVNHFKNYQTEMKATHKVSESSMIQRMHTFSLLEWRVPEFIPNTTPDKIYATMAPYILNMQWMQLIDELSKISTKGPLLDNTLNIDLSGFSRGAALASIFANKIDQYTKDNYFQYTAKWLPPGQQQVRACLNLRFVGLFDTVHQLGALGNQNSHFSYTASPAWAVFAHAVALNEHRKIMPLTIFSDDNTANVYEQGFLGSHSDIGGAIFDADLEAQTNPYKGTYGDLSNIPLNWIYHMAEHADVKLKPLNALTQWQLDTIKNPLLHMTSPFEKYTINSSWRINDRRVYSATGKNLSFQFFSKSIGGKTRVEHNQSVSFLVTPQYDAISSTQGTSYPYAMVRAREYLNFLESSTQWSSSLKVISQQP